MRSPGCRGPLWALGMGRGAEMIIGSSSKVTTFPTLGLGSFSFSKDTLLAFGCSFCRSSVLTAGRIRGSSAAEDTFLSFFGRASSSSTLSTVTVRTITGLSVDLCRSLFISPSSSRETGLSTTTPCGRRPSLGELWAFMRLRSLSSIASSTYSCREVLWSRCPCLEALSSRCSCREMLSSRHSCLEALCPWRDLPLPRSTASVCSGYWCSLYSSFFDLRYA
ncbi:hypothetical protein F4818DRAFT_397077 [Hypoxylon cercidicola]|nr:hypothetical protein F4818DRAFT_397077 [Hypoxylon cercidicola]